MKRRDPRALDDGAVAARWREALEAGTGEIDGAARARLARARHEAVAAATRPVRKWAWALPAGALAALLAVWVAVRPTPPPLPAPGTDVADYAQGLVVATEVDAAALDEDLEFYAWLDAQAEAGG